MTFLKIRNFLSNYRAPLNPKDSPKKEGLAPIGCCTFFQDKPLHKPVDKPLDKPVDKPLHKPLHKPYINRI